MLISDWMNKSELNSTVIWQDKFLKNWSYLYQDTSSFSRSHSLHGPSVLLPSSAEAEGVILLRSGSGSGQGISRQGHDPAAELHRLQTGRGLKCSVCRYFISCWFKSEVISTFHSVNGSNPFGFDMWRGKLCCQNVVSKTCLYVNDVWTPGESIGIYLSAPRYHAPLVPSSIKPCHSCTSFGNHFNFLIKYKLLMMDVRTSWSFLDQLFVVKVFYPINPTSENRAAAWAAASPTPLYTDPDPQDRGSLHHTRHQRTLWGRHHQRQDLSRFLCLPWSKSTIIYKHIFLLLLIVERQQWTLGMDKKTSTITAGNKENEKVFPQSILVDMMMIWMAQDSTKTNYLITHCNHK